MIIFPVFVKQIIGNWAQLSFFSTFLLSLYSPIIYMFIINIYMIIIIIIWLNINKFINICIHIRFLKNKLLEHYENDMNERIALKLLIY